MKFIVGLKGRTLPWKLDRGLDPKRPLQFRPVFIRRQWNSLFRPVSATMLEHQFSYLARVRDRTCFRLLQIAASQGFKKSAMDVNPEVSLQILVCLCHIEHAGQHQLFHQLNQSPVPAGASDDQMKIRISLNLLSIFFDAGLGGLSCLIDNSFKSSKVVFGDTSEAQLHGKQVEGIHKCVDLGVVGIGPAAHIHATRRSPLDDSDLLQAVKSITHGRPAHLEALRQILFTEPLVGNELPFSNAVKNLEDDPVSQCTNSRLRRNSGRFVEQIQYHDSRQYTISRARNSFAESYFGSWECELQIL